MTCSTPLFESLHAHYCKLTDRNLPMTMTMHFVWESFVAKGFAANDLEIVVAHIKRLIQKNRRRPESLRFHNLIENQERFVEDLAEARALSRRPKPNAGLESVLRSSGRAVEQVQNTARSASDILKDMEALAAFRQFKESL